MSERVAESCSVQFSFDIMMVAISFNAIKLSAMLFILFRFGGDAEVLLASVGDAAMSFLTLEDRTTYQMCLASKRDIE